MEVVSPNNNGASSARSSLDSRIEKLRKIPVEDKPLRVSNVHMVPPSPTPEPPKLQKKKLSNGGYRVYLSKSLGGNWRCIFDSTKELELSQQININKDPPSRRYRIGGFLVNEGQLQV